MSANALSLISRIPTAATAFESKPVSSKLLVDTGFFVSLLRQIQPTCHNGRFHHIPFFRSAQNIDHLFVQPLRLRKHFCRLVGIQQLSQPVLDEVGKRAALFDHLRCGICHLLAYAYREINIPISNYLYLFQQPRPLRVVKHIFRRNPVDIDITPSSARTTRKSTADRILHVAVLLADHLHRQSIRQQ